MASPAPVIPAGGVDPLATLGTQERAVLAALLANRGRVVNRHELARLAGIANCTERRIDSLLVGVRRALGADSIVTVRRRGWMLTEAAADAAAPLV
jgi:DNA-binding winged helix-turn-helix (wHTH) protein